MRKSNVFHGFKGLFLVGLILISAGFISAKIATPASAIGPINDPCVDYCMKRYPTNYYAYLRCLVDCR